MCQTSMSICVHSTYMYIQVWTYTYVYVQVYTGIYKYTGIFHVLACMYFAVYVLQFSILQINSINHYDWKKLDPVVPFAGLAFALVIISNYHPCTVLIHNTALYCVRTCLTWLCRLLWDLVMSFVVCDMYIDVFTRLHRKTHQQVCALTNLLN